MNYSNKHRTTLRRSERGQQRYSGRGGLKSIHPTGDNGHRGEHRGKISLFRDLAYKTKKRKGLKKLAWSETQRILNKLDDGLKRLDSNNSVMIVKDLSKITTETELLSIAGKGRLYGSALGATGSSSHSDLRIEIDGKTIIDLSTDMPTSGYNYSCFSGLGSWFDLSDFLQPDRYFKIKFKNILIVDGQAFDFYAIKYVPLSSEKQSFSRSTSAGLYSIIDRYIEFNKSLKIYGSGKSIMRFVCEYELE